MDDIGLSLIIREGVFESFDATVYNKSNGCAHKGTADNRYNIGPQHEHAFLLNMWSTLRSFSSHLAILPGIISQQKNEFILLICDSFFRKKF